MHNIKQSICNKEETDRDATSVARYRIRRVFSLPSVVTQKANTQDSDVPAARRSHADPDTEVALAVNRRNNPN